MKLRFTALFMLFALLAIFAVAAPNANAASDAWCWSDPEEGSIGTVFNVYCSGFTPNTHVSTYMVEPDGAASLWGSSKTNEKGDVAFSFYSKWGNYGAAALGKWTFVTEELGLAKTVLVRGTASFRVTGGTEGVSGAKIWGSADQIHKGDWYTLYGSGFMPYEIVTVWWEYPNGDCSSFTEHFPPYANYPLYWGLSTLQIMDLKANAAGEISASGYWDSWDCEGTYHWVARGNTSGDGGEAWVTVIGDTVDTNAWLWADKDVVGGINEYISFSGSGFGASESVTCWLRTPQNQALEVFNIPEVKTDGSGTFSFTTWTGGYFPGYNYFSEGALGVYAMSCRGNLSGATAIAEFTVTGGVVDP